MPKELNEYLKETKMTVKKRNPLREWVARGHSVHDNTSIVMCTGGYPIDFLDIYHEE